ncbi:MAG: acyltransferase [Oligoflexia bacterium]|nr:acyltransferase [Oligoflexia bacterium]
MEPSRTQNGYLNEDFLNLIKKDREHFSKLSSDTKIWLYRVHGAIIGGDMRFSPGSIILSKHIEIGESVFIGNDVVIETDSLCLGTLSYIGHSSTIHARKVFFHENVFLSKNVEVGGGGFRDPESEIEIHSHCHIGQDVHLNCCRRIEIGEESTITIGTMIMTHCFANSVLEGYPVVFSPVKIGRNVQIGLRCTIFPGVTIEDGAVVGSNSNVMSKVSAETYYCGVPAKALGPAKKTYSPERQYKIATDLVLDFIKQLTLLKYNVEVLRGGYDEINCTVTLDQKKMKLIFRKVIEIDQLHEVIDQSDETLYICLSAMPSHLQNVEKIAVIGLLEKKIIGTSGLLTNTLREFLRKRGIRLIPKTWSYRGGLI